MLQAQVILKSNAKWSIINLIKLIYEDAIYFLFQTLPHFIRPPKIKHNRLMNN